MGRQAVAPFFVLSRADSSTSPVRTGLSLVVLALAAACGGEDGSAKPGAADGPPTFARDVASIVFANCSVCHRPGEAAPFSLLTYEDVRKRAKQVAVVTGSHYMPPWLPAPIPGVAFHADRSLTEAEIDVLARWADAGAPEGDPDQTPPQPRWTEGWQLGQPDLVVRMPRTYTVPTEGRDLYRNFLLPAPLRPGSNKRFVRAVEWRVDNRTVLHHAVLFIDRTGAARMLEAEDGAPGYAGMGPGRAQVPDGQFVGWAPGKVTRAGEDGIAWMLDDRTDIVLQLHMRPSGKPEQIRVAVGLFFADESPDRTAVSIRLMSTDIDIPAGESAYRVEDSYRTPVDMVVRGIYPHAHYLAREMRGFATLPDGSRRELFHIPDWDFNWQDEYFYVEPVALPKDSVIAMEFTYDNSSGNPLNPTVPPKRVVFGEQSDDEMGELLLQVEPSTEDLPILWRDFAWKVHFDDVEYFERKALAEPDNPRWHGQLGNLASRGGRTEEAVRRFERVVELRPRAARPLANLGHAHVVGGNAASAVEALRKALALDERLVSARVDLGKALTARGEFEQAKIELERCLAELPGQPEVHDALGLLFVALDDVDAAARQFEAALASNSEDTEALTSLGRLRFGQGERDEAIALYRRALARYPDESSAHHLLGIALDAGGERAEAIRHLATAASLAPGNADYARELERVRAKPQ